MENRKRGKEQMRKMRKTGVRERNKKKNQVTGLGGSCEIKSEEAAAHRIKFPCCTGQYTS
jgi:hypothetical protein